MFGAQPTLDGVVGAGRFGADAVAAVLLAELPIRGACASDGSAASERALCSDRLCVLPAPTPSRRIGVAARVRAGAFGTVPSAEPSGLDRSIASWVRAPFFHAMGVTESTSFRVGLTSRLRADAVCTVLPAESPCLRVRFTPGRHTFISSPVFFAHASLYNEGSTGRVAAHFLPLTVWCHAVQRNIFLRIIDECGLFYSGESHPLARHSGLSAAHVLPLAACKASLYNHGRCFTRQRCCYSCSQQRGVEEMFSCVIYDQVSCSSCHCW